MTDPKPNVDGIAPAIPPEASLPTVSLEQKKRAERMILILFSIPYVLYILWCLFLTTVLPNASGTFDRLIPMGLLSAGIAFLILLFVAAIALKHALGAKSATPMGKLNAFIRTIGFILPGIIASVAMPMMIVREPPLPLDIVSPAEGVELVAPVAVTFGLESATTILARKNLRPVAYKWDYDGDGNINEESVIPQVTALYDRTGAYNVTAHVQLSDGTIRRVGRRLLITKAVFSVSPADPIIDQPVTLTVEQLVPKDARIREVRWDYDDDGKPDEVRTDATVTHVFVRLGTHNVAVTVQLDNQTQQTYRRKIEIRDPPPQPFDLKISTEPKKLLSPPPFGTIFTLVTQEPLREVEWNFNDSSDKVKTTDQHRVGHTFDHKGNFRVIAEARSKNGEIAVASVLVQVVDSLRVQDLTFEGSSEVQNNKITGEAPLTIDLTPHTSLPLVDFSWEAPDATSLGSTDTTLQAIYRRPGTYKITLLASDPEGKAMRLPISIEVKPPSSVVSFQMDKKSGVAPFKVRFDASETVIPNETISGFEWIFGDEITGVIRKQGIAIEEHVFEKPGKYPVKLVVYTTASNTFESTSTIVVLPPRLDACFVPSRTNGRMEGKPFGVSFDKSCSTGIVTSLKWNFDDGAESDDSADRIVHVFEQPGTYDVSLTIQDTTGAKSTVTHQIVVNP